MLQGLDKADGSATVLMTLCRLYGGAGGTRAWVIAPTPFLTKVLVAITEAGILALFILDFGFWILEVSGIHSKIQNLKPKVGLQLRDSAGLDTGFPHCRPGFRASGDLCGTLLFSC